MKQRFLSGFCSILFAAVSLAGCGGGGGGGGGQQQPSVTTSSVAVSGTVVDGTRLSGLVASGLKKAATASANLSSGAQIVVQSYDKNGKLIEEVTTVSTDGGAFSSNIKIQSTGGYITVKAVKDNFTSFEKTFTYKTIDEFQSGLSNILAELDPLVTRVVNVTDRVDFTTAGASSDDTLSIAVVKSGSGAKSIVANNEIKLAKASGSDVVWQIDLSKSQLRAASITSLKISAENYNPADAEDSRRFPSETDDSGNMLASTGFDFIDIKTNTGEALKLSSASASSLGKAAAITYRVKRQIPACSLITKDEDTSKDGVQVGFYTLRSGKWTKLGNATLYEDSNSDSTIEDTELLSGVSACSDSNLPYAVLTQEDITNLDFTNNWWNLDYVVTGTISIGCVEGKMNSVKSDGTEEALAGRYVYLSDLAGITGFRSSYGFTRDDGTFKLEFPYASGTLAGASATLNYSNPFTYGWDTAARTLEATTNANGCYEVEDIDIADPYDCTVTGKVVKSGAGVPNRWVYTYQTGTYYGYKWAYTDSSGNYSMPVMCGTDYDIANWGMASIKTFNVNGTVGTDESSDASNIVGMPDITLTNNPPYAYAYATAYSITTIDNVWLYSYAYDPDGDPLTYSWSENCSGSFSDSKSQYTAWTPPTTAPVSGVCTVTLTVSDGSLDGTATLDISVTDGNRPPVITNILVPQNVKEGKSPTLYAYAYDPDGDALIYSWSDNACGGSFGASSSQTPTPVWTAPNGDASCLITLTVSDGTASAVGERTIKVNANRPPVITGINVPSEVPKNKSGSLFAFAYDPDGDSLTYSWSATCGTMTNAGSQNPTWTAPDAETICDIELTVSDPSGGSDSDVKTIQVTNTTPVISAFSVPDTASVGATLALSVTATDADGDTLTYKWLIQGTEVGSGSSYTWNVLEAGSYSVTVEVSDGKNKAIQSKTVVVSGSTSGNITIK